jgi:hypothetical protein
MDPLSILAGLAAFVLDILQDTLSVVPLRTVLEQLER